MCTGLQKEQSSEEPPKGHCSTAWKPRHLLLVGNPGTGTCRLGSKQNLKPHLAAQVLLYQCDHHFTQLQELEAASKIPRELGQSCTGATLVRNISLGTSEGWVPACWHCSLTHILTTYCHLAVTEMELGVVH